MTVTIPVWALWAAGILSAVVVFALAALGLVVVHAACHWSRR